jgi:hypothetical protein
MNNQALEQKQKDLKEMYLRLKDAQYGSDLSKKQIRNIFQELYVS